MESTSKFSIVRIISAKLNLGDQGKLDSFFERAVKFLKKEIDGLKANLNVLKFNFDTIISDLKDQLQDAEDALKDSYEAVEIDNIINNDAQKKFLETYLDNISKCEKEVETINEKIEKETETYNEKVSDIQKEIEFREKRIAKIGAE